MEKNKLNRRRFLRDTGASAVAVVASALAGKSKAGGAVSEEEASSSRGSLYDKVYGCIAGAYLGSSFGVPVEGWDRRKISHRYGLLEEFQPFRVRGRTFPAGSTEDGIERQKYMYMAIIEKQDRITADDSVRMWLKVMNAEKLAGMKRMTEAFDRGLMEKAQSGEVPAGQLGEGAYAHLNTPIRCFHPIVLINACDEEGAIRDTHDVLRVYQPLTSDGYAWGAAYNAAAAHALRADATVDSVIETALRYSTDEMREEIRAGLDIAAKYSAPIDERKAFYEDFARIYNKETCTGYYDMSRAHECATIALSIFKATKGNVKEAIILAANNGRDTDCNCAASGGLAGAFSGTITIPSEWIQIVDAATKENPYTNSQLTIEETAKGMYSALQNKVRKMEAYVGLMKSQS